MFKSSVLFLFVFCLHQVASEDDEYFSVEAKLIQDLLKDYDPQISPNQHKQTLQFSLDMTLSQIISLNAKSQEMTTSSYLQHDWSDPRLTWEPKLHDNIHILRLPAETVWKPRLLLGNSKDGSFDISLHTMVLVFNDGHVSWLPPALYKSICVIEISKFPFDNQVCNISLVSPTFDSDEIEFIVPKPNITIDQAAYQENGEWNLTSTWAEVNQDRDGYVFTVYLKRKPLFYIINIIVPCMLLSACSCLVFYLPSCTCEKFTLATSVLLGQTVFFFLIAQRTPETSMAVPIIGIYILFLMSLVVFSLIVSVMICNINFRSNNSHKMPFLLKYFFIEIMAPFLNVERPSSGDDDQSEQTGDTDLSFNEEEAEQLRQDAKRSLSQQINDRFKSPSQSFFEEHAGRYNILSRGINRGGLAQSSSGGHNSWTPPPILGLPPSVWSTFESICYVARSKKLEDDKSQSQDDWSYLALILDRFLLWIYNIAFVLGFVGFVMKANGY